MVGGVGRRYRNRSWGLLVCMVMSACTVGIGGGTVPSVPKEQIVVEQIRNENGIGELPSKNAGMIKIKQESGLRIFRMASCNHGTTYWLRKT